MPDMQLPSKNWVKANKAALARQVHGRNMDIKDLLSNYIDAIGKEHFCHCGKKNFCRIFRDFAAAFDLEAKCCGARR
jgi:hypothetical protein